MEVSGVAHIFLTASNFERSRFAPAHRLALR
jgi:hypothetical protein